MPASLCGGGLRGREPRPRTATLRARVQPLLSVFRSRRGAGRRRSGRRAGEPGARRASRPELCLPPSVRGLGTFTERKFCLVLFS